MKIIPVSRASNKAPRLRSKSARNAVYRAVTSAGKTGTDVSALQRKLRKLSAAQIRGCVAKLRALKLVRTNN